VLVCARRASIRPVFAKAPQQSDYSTHRASSLGNTRSVSDTRARVPRVLWKRCIPTWAFRLRPFHARMFYRHHGDFSG
jgi:hypothetical protein